MIDFVFIIIRLLKIELIKSTENMVHKIAVAIKGCAHIAFEIK